MTRGDMLRGVFALAVVCITIGTLVVWTMIGSDSSSPAHEPPDAPSRPTATLA